MTTGRTGGRRIDFGGDVNLEMEYNTKLYKKMLPIFVEMPAVLLTDQPCINRHLHPEVMEKIRCKKESSGSCAAARLLLENLRKYPGFFDSILEAMDSPSLMLTECKSRFLSVRVWMPAITGMANAIHLPSEGTPAITGMPFPYPSIQMPAIVDSPEWLGEEQSVIETSDQGEFSDIIGQTVTVIPVWSLFRSNGMHISYKEHVDTEWLQQHPVNNNAVQFRPPTQDSTGGDQGQTGMLSDSDCEIQQERAHL